VSTSGHTGAVFVGRQQEISELNSALDDAIAGHGRLVMLAGEPGIGKTSIAQELTSRARALGALVFWGWCYEREGSPPY
jgi:predicted ATPase